MSKAATPLCHLFSRHYGSGINCHRARIQTGTIYSPHHTWPARSNCHSPLSSYISHPREEVGKNCSLGPGTWPRPQVSTHWGSSKLTHCWPQLCVGSSWLADYVIIVHLKTSRGWSLWDKLWDKCWIFAGYTGQIIVIHYRNYSQCVIVDFTSPKLNRPIHCADMWVTFVYIWRSLVSLDEFGLLFDLKKFHCFSWNSFKSIFMVNTTIFWSRHFISWLCAHFTAFQETTPILCCMLLYLLLNQNDLPDASLLGNNIILQIKQKILKKAGWDFDSLSKIGCLKINNIYLI